MPQGINGERIELERKLSAPPSFPDAPVNGDQPVSLIASARFPTRFGDFTLYGFSEQAAEGPPKEHTALVRDNGQATDEWLVRVHSECHTGDVLGSLRCDCREQLEFSLNYISRQTRGALVYLRQEGRGIGLLNKIKAYHLQDLGLDTIEANQYLGFAADTRDYRVAAAILRTLGIGTAALLTNNPAKVAGLKEHGISITRRVPVVAAANPHNREYLDIKRTRMGHLLD